MIQSISLIGSGRLATALGKGFQSKGIRINQVYSRNIEHAKSLAKELNAEPTDSLQLLKDTSDLFLLAVSDSAIAGLVPHIPFTHIPVIHCSGSQEMSQLSRFERFGVIYPPQTFSFEHEVDLECTPFFLEASDDAFLADLLELTALISGSIHFAATESRLRIHLAAVFANNFTNHFYHIAGDLLKKDRLPLDILFPIMQETLNKIKLVNPAKAQTGPAARNDIRVLEKHLQLLSDRPEYGKIYSFVSESILNTQKSS